MRNLGFLLILISLLTGCEFFSSNVPFCNRSKQLVARTPLPNDEEVITLQNQVSRVIVKCYANPYEPAETCARFYESQNYTRLSEIPYKTANFDFLKAGNYPTRRWRPDEKTPRW